MKNLLRLGMVSVLVLLASCGGPAVPTPSVEGNIPVKPNYTAERPSVSSSSRPSNTSPEDSPTEEPETSKPDAEPAPTEEDSASSEEDPSPDEAEPASVEEVRLELNDGVVLGGTANPTFPDGEPGKVSVVAESMSDGRGYVFVAIRNNTDKPITRIDMTGMARADEMLVGSGSSHDWIPAVIKPGAVGIGFVYFDNLESIPDNAEYTFDVTWEGTGESSFYASRDLNVTEVNIVGNSFVGSAVNRMGRELDGPFGVEILCFEGNDIVDAHSAYTDQSGPIKHNDMVTFSDRIYGDLCPNYVVSVTGYLK